MSRLPPKRDKQRRVTRWLQSGSLRPVFAEKTRTRMSGCDSVTRSFDHRDSIQGGDIAYDGKTAASSVDASSVVGGSTRMSSIEMDKLVQHHHTRAQQNNGGGEDDASELGGGVEDDASELAGGGAEDDASELAGGGEDDASELAGGGEDDASAQAGGPAGGQVGKAAQPPHRTDDNLSGGNKQYDTGEPERNEGRNKGRNKGRTKGRNKGRNNSVLRGGRARHANGVRNASTQQRPSTKSRQSAKVEGEVEDEDEDEDEVEDEVDVDDDDDYEEDEEDEVEVEDEDDDEDEDEDDDDDSGSDNFGSDVDFGSDGFASDDTYEDDFDLRHSGEYGEYGEYGASRNNSMSGQSSDVSQDDIDDPDSGLRRILFGANGRRVLADELCDDEGGAFCGSDEEDGRAERMLQNSKKARVARLLLNAVRRGQPIRP